MWHAHRLTLLDKLGRLGLIDWSRASLDSACIPAKRGEETGVNPVDRGRPGSKRHLLVDGEGLPLSVILTGASVHDSEMNQGIAKNVRTLLIIESPVVPYILWVSLIVLAILLIGFSYMIGMESRLLRLLAIGAMAGGIALVLFTIAALDRPFATNGSGESRAVRLGTARDRNPCRIDP